MHGKVKVTRRDTVPISRSFERLMQCRPVALPKFVVRSDLEDGENLECQFCQSEGILSRFGTPETPTLFLDAVRNGNPEVSGRRIRRGEMVLGAFRRCPLQHKWVNREAYRPVGISRVEAILADGLIPLKIIQSR